MGIPAKEITLPPSDDGYYRFGKLQDLIADALYPSDDGPTDYLTQVVIWREDGTEDGQYLECEPPKGAQLQDFSRSDEWKLIAVPDEEARRIWLHDRHYMQQLAHKRREHWPDGSLVVHKKTTAKAEDQAWQWDSERRWYSARLTQAAQLPSGAPGRLQVVDGSRNEVEFRDGSALADGYVHIDWLNAWGETQQPVNVFHKSPSTTVEPIDVSEPPPLLPWKMLVQAIAAELWTTFREAEANPTIAGIVDQVARRCVERGIKTSSGINPTAAYLRVHVLSAKHWTPPDDRRR
ncbi:hypothetical protein ACFOHU_16385 [Ottowia pentelensis]|uniref:Uncharacterized protein n=1 Tax=Ottowia pentelensis TaxID=511108 RepID=A0ABV6PW95_9BURK